MDRDELIRWGHINEPIIGAETEERECSTCRGSGTISGYELVLGFCPAVVEIVEHEVLSCVVKGFHEGPHQTIMEVPCERCWGMDVHRDWCPVIEDNSETVGQMVVLFDNNGQYWVKPGWVG
jgi:hypothetical protein